MAKPSPPPRNPAVEAAVQRLESLSRAGVTHMRHGVNRSKKPSAADRPAESEAAVPKVTKPASAPTPAKAAPATVAPAPKPGSKTKPAPKTIGRQQALAEVATVVAQCTRCAELARTRTQTVFGTGSPNTRLVFCGEAPGADEDRQGEPFVGAAGQLLNKIITACTLKREDVYILNILRCRPPGNRTPAPDEAANCREYLDAQLDIIRPEYLCCLGACAAHNLLETTEALGKLRGRFHDYRGIKVLCTYHPAYLLRNPNAKRPTWEDMQMLMAAMGVKLPKSD
ncbi:MAG: uracil-DNA glycosylase [Patescibacteria group bacterium]|nr:uracil-DNA glycosylase [Patescibacteria group bacterium]